MKRQKTVKKCWSVFRKAQDDTQPKDIQFSVIEE